MVNHQPCQTSEALDNFSFAEVLMPEGDSHINEVNVNKKQCVCACASVSACLCECGPYKSLCTKEIADSEKWDQF